MHCSICLAHSIGPATTQWDITTCTTQGTSYTTSPSAMAANLPSPTQSTTSSNTMLNGGDSTHGDLNGNGSGEYEYFVCSLVPQAPPSFSVLYEKNRGAWEIKSHGIRHPIDTQQTKSACSTSRVVVAIGARLNLNWSNIFLLLQLSLYF